MVKLPAGLPLSAALLLEDPALRLLVRIKHALVVPPLVNLHGKKSAHTHSVCALNGENPHQS